MRVHLGGQRLVFRVIPPAAFKTAPWRNGGGVTHEIAREDADGTLLWRISIAEVASDGPFSRFEGLTRILTVIEGAGLDLVTPDGVIAARPGVPVRFSGDIPVDCRLVAGAVRDLNVIFDARRIDAEVSVASGPAAIPIGGPQLAGFVGLSGGVNVDGVPLEPGAFALGPGGEIRLSPGASGLLVRLAASPSR
mgnify:FL=1